MWLLISWFALSLVSAVCFGALVHWGRVGHKELPNGIHSNSNSDSLEI